MNQVENGVICQLQVEELRQLHEHIRHHEGAMNTILNIVVVGSTTLLAAISGFFFDRYAGSTNTAPALLCYLFVAPVPLLIAGFALLSSHRDAIYRFGFYIKVFIEEPLGGAMWHTRLDEIRKAVKGESKDPVVQVMWSMFALSSVLFVVAIMLASEKHILHIATLVPLAGFMAYYDWQFRSSRASIETSWRSVRSFEGDNSTPGNRPLSEEKH